MAIETFDLGRVLQTAEAIKGMKRQATMDGLQEQYLKGQIARGDQQAQYAANAEARDATKFSQEQQLNNTRTLNVAAKSVATDPSPENVTRWVPVLKQSGIVGQDFDVSNLHPDELKVAAGRIAAQTDGDLQAYLSQNPQFMELDKQHQYRLEEIKAKGLEDRKAAGLRGAENVNMQLITRPVGNGLVQDFAWNPRTNQRVPNGEPYRPVTPHTGNVTEGERKAAALGTRLEAALQSLNSVEQAAPGSSKPGLFERGAEAIGAEAIANTIRSSDRQRADAAQLDALDAALTLATGAAYTKEQLQNLRKSYFPQISDSAANVADKKKRFETIVETARIAAGRAEPSIDQAVGNSRGATGSWKVERVNN